MNSLKMARLEYTLTMEKRVVFPDFIGNTLRGVIGNAFINLYCRNKNPECDNCVEKDSCVYSTVFKCSFSTEYIEKAPNPFIIDTELNKKVYAEGDKIRFSIVLLGYAVDFFKAFNDAIAYSAENGFGDRKYKIALEKIYDVYGGREIGADEAPTEILWTDEGGSAEEVSHIRIKFITPFEYKNHSAADITFYDFCDRLFSRIADLVDMYGEGEFILPYNFAKHKNKVETVCNLETYMVHQNRFEIDALFGTIDFYGKLTRYMPYVRLGSEVHFGRFSTRGLGKYIFEIC